MPLPRAQHSAAPEGKHEALALEEEAGGSWMSWGSVRCPSCLWMAGTFSGGNELKETVT